MTSDSFDELDRALASGLSALAPDVGGADETLTEMRPRFERARTRARLVRAGGTLLALVGIGTVATLAAPNSTRSHVSVSSPSSTPATKEHGFRSSTTSASTTTRPAQTGISQPSFGTTPTTSHDNQGSTPSTAPMVVPTTVTGGSNGNGSGSSGGGSHGGGSESPSTTVAPPADVHEYRSPVGSLTVRFSGGVLKLLHVSPADGCAYSVHDNTPSHVQVRFTRNGEEKARIELQVENGHLVRLDHNDA